VADVTGDNYTQVWNVNERGIVGVRMTRFDDIYVMPLEVDFIPL
jgi:hypothetical protein